MKRFYYFSKNKLKFVEIQNFYKQFIFLTVFFTVLVSFFVFTGYIVLDAFVNPDSDIRELQLKNRELKRIISILKNEYNLLDGEINNLYSTNNTLRKQSRLSLLSNNVVYNTLYKNSNEAFTVNKVGEFTTLVGKTDSLVELLSGKIENKLSEYNKLDSLVANKKEILNNIPSMLPCKGELGDGFGKRVDPILKIELSHKGQIIIAPVDTPVYAPADGKVIYRGRTGGYGRTLRIDHGNGFVTFYGNLSNYEVRKYKKVKRGDIIGYTGNTGKLSTGPHLYYQVEHNDIPVDPLNFVFDNYNTFNKLENNSTIKE